MRAVLKAQINKTDRNDARGMAQMMRVGLYRPVHVKTLRSQKLRMLLTHRKLLQSKVIAIDNDLRGTLRNLGGGFVQRPLVEALIAMGVDAPAGSGLKNTRVEELRTLFEQAGLQQVTTRTIEIEVSYQNFDDYWSAQTGFANLVVQPIRKMSAPDVARLQTYLRDRLPTDHSGRIAYAARANAVKGRAPN
jgi:hypothetical protein